MASSSISRSRNASFAAASRPRHAYSATSCAGLALAVGLVAVPAVAADSTWIQTSGSFQWSNNANWNNNAPGSTSSTTSTDIATFSTMTATGTATVDNNRNVGGIIFSSTSTFGIVLWLPSTTGTLRLTNSGTIQATSDQGVHADVVNVRVSIQGDGGSATFLANGSGTLSFANANGGIVGNSTAGNTTTLYLGGTSTVVGLVGNSAIISDGAVGGKVAVVKNDSGVWTFTNANTYTGGLTVNAGRVRFSSTSGRLGAGLVTLNGGTVSANGNGATAVAAANNILVGGNFGLGNATDTSPLLLSGSVDLGNATRIVTVASSGTFSGVISNGGLTKDGSANLALTATNTYSGNTLISGGTLSIGNSLALQNSGFDTAGAGRLNATGITAPTFGGLLGSTNLSTTNIVGYGSITGLTLNPQSGKSHSYGGVIGNGAANMTLTKTGPGTQRLTGVNTYSGTTFVNAGLLEVGDSGNLSNTARVVVSGSGAELKWNSSTALSAPLTVTQGTISGTGAISASGGVTIGSNAVISPGNSPGIQTYTTGLTWASGGSYIWEIDNWTGAAGTGYDQVQVTGGPLDITATSGSTFTIFITGLSGTAQGAVTNFLGTQSKTFTIATALSGGGVTNFLANKFTLDTSGFTSNNTIPTGGSFSISDTGTTVLLNYTYTPPVTSTSYTLSGSAAASAIHVGGTTTITAIVTNTGTGTADSLGVTGLGVTVSPTSASVTISPTSGTAAIGGGTFSGNGNFTTATAGSYSFTPTVTSATNMTLGTAATATGTTSATVSVYNYAAANSISGTTSFGTVLKNTVLSSTLSISNTAPTGSFTEKLDAVFSGTTGQASGSGSISLLAAGTSSTAMIAYLASGSAGPASGSVTIGFTSNGDGTSGLGTTPLDSQTVSLMATVLDPAVASFASGSTLGTLTYNFGTFNEGDTVPNYNFNIYNLLQTAGYTADLALTSIVATSTTGPLTTDLATFNTLVSGTYNPYVAFASTALAGTFTNTWTLTFQSSIGGVPQGDTQTLTLTTNVVVVPEPGTLALAGLGIGLAGIAASRRRRRG